MGGSQSVSNNRNQGRARSQSENRPSGHQQPQNQPPQRNSVNPRQRAAPTQPATGGKVVVMNNDISMIPKSIKLVKSTTNPKMHSITFLLDTLFETIVSAFFFVHDMRDPLLEVTYELSPDEKHKIPPKHLKFPAGRLTSVAENCYCIELEKYSDEELSAHTNEFYPLIIRIEKIDPAKREKKVFFYYFHFVKEENVYNIKLLRQKMELNGQAFEINDIYGITSSEFGIHESATVGDSEKECIICFSSQRDTIILPCRHMCLCVDCAKSLQSQSNSKCPICRKDIESFLRLTKNAAQTQSRPVLDEQDLENIA